MPGAFAMVGFESRPTPDVHRSNVGNASGIPHRPLSRGGESLLSLPDCELDRFRLAGSTEGHLKQFDLFLRGGYFG